MSFDFDDIEKRWQKNKFRLQCFDPVLTYSKEDNYAFINANGKPNGKLNPDTESLFMIGKEAFSRLTQGEQISREEFEEYYKSYFNYIGELRTLMIELHSKGEPYIVNKKGERLSSNLSELDDYLVLHICWDAPFLESNKQKTKDIFCNLFLIHALREIDNSLIGIGFDGRGAVAAAISAANSLSNAISIEIGSDKEQEIRQEMGYRGAIEKLKRDPKQEAKRFVRECWDDWQSNPDRYKSQAKFARDMIEKWPVLENQASIEHWCRSWKKGSLS